MVPVSSGQPRISSGKIRPELRSMIFDSEDNVRSGLLLRFALVLISAAIGSSFAAASENRTYKCRTGTVELLCGDDSGRGSCPIYRT